MKKLQIAVLTTSLLGLVGTAAATICEQNQLTNDGADNQSQSINFPFTLDSHTAIVAGTIKRSAVINRIDNPDLVPIPVMCQSDLALSAMFAQNISDSSSGPYNEMVNTIFVQKANAAPLDLPCLENTDQQSVANYINAALVAITVANADNLAAGMPLDYGMYTDSLLVTTADALTIGIEVWGFPKELRKIAYDINDQHYKVTANAAAGNKFRMTIERAPALTLHLPQFELNGDFFVPNSLAPAGYLPQMNGKIFSAAGSPTYLYPFSGEFNGKCVNCAAGAPSLGHQLSELGKSRFTDFHVLADFTPTLVFELPHAHGEFYSNRQ